MNTQSTDSTSAARILRTSRVHNALSAALATQQPAYIVVAADDVDSESAIWSWFGAMFADHNLSIYDDGKSPRELVVSRGSARVATVLWAVR